MVFVVRPGQRVVSTMIAQVDGASLRGLAPMKDPRVIPDFEQYYTNLAFAVRKRANCKGHKVGAVLIVKNRIVSTGYNGVPEGMTNCLDGGCDRCANPQKYKSGEGYDVCICVHAEDNALLTAARFGISIEGGSIYTTVKPCFSCMKALHQAGIGTVYYHKEWRHPEESFNPNPGAPR
jgi:dCMP deaminase